MKTPARCEPTLPERAPRVRLTTLADQASVHFETTRPVTLLGSRRDCDLFVSQGDASKTHCALVNTGTTIIATDLCSRSGTFLNGERISTARLHPGDELRVGSVPIGVQFLNVPDSTPTPTACENETGTAVPVPLRLNGAQQQYELVTLPVVIGRRNACHVVLDTPDVSLAHALLFTIEGRPAIFDLGSRSGTYLNGDRVTLAWLYDGDQLCIGGEELTLAWEGPQHTEREATTSPAAGTPDSTKADDTTDHLRASGLEDLSAMIEDLKAQIGASQAQLRERAASLNQREVELETRKAELEQERARFAVEKQQFEQQAADLQDAISRLQEDRDRFETERAESQQERSQLEAQRAALAQRLAEYETTISKLEGRETALDQRQAALDTLQQELAEQQARLAEGEAANTEAARKIRQFKDTLSEARRVFASVEVLSKQPPTSSAPPVGPTNSAAKPGDGLPLASAGTASSDDLPAPMVGQPLFAAPDANSPEQCPAESRAQQPEQPGQPRRRAQN